MNNSLCVLAVSLAITASLTGCNETNNVPSTAPTQELAPCKQGPFKNQKELEALLKSLDGKPQDDLIKTLGRPDIVIGESWQYSKAPGADYCSEPDAITQKKGRLGFSISVENGTVRSGSPTVIFLSDDVISGSKN